MSSTNPMTCPVHETTLAAKVVDNHYRWFCPTCDAVNESATETDDDVPYPYALIDSLRAERDRLRAELAEAVDLAHAIRGGAGDSMLDALASAFLAKHEGGRDA